MNLSMLISRFSFTKEEYIIAIMALRLFMTGWSSWIVMFMIMISSSCSHNDCMLIEIPITNKSIYAQQGLYHVEEEI